MRSIKSGFFINLNHIQMQKKAKVLEVKYEKSWSPPDGGLLHFHWVKMDNGDEGSYCSKSEKQDKFVVGQEVEYDFTPPAGDSHGKIKPIYNQQGGGHQGGRSKGSYNDPKRQEMIIRQSCLERATELEIHNANCRVPEDGNPVDCSVDPDRIMARADVYAQWVTKNGDLL